MSKETRFLSVSTFLVISQMLITLPIPALAANLPQGKTLEESSDTFLKAWLWQDVAYLASDAEKTAYLNLASDPERYAFIERFWQQRDPSPGTTENEFRDQHYWRINYANERFGGTEQGWKSDRGRIYITWGPPDQIESHPSGEGRSGPFEIWIYRERADRSTPPERRLEFGGADYELRER